MVTLEGSEVDSNRSRESSIVQPGSDCGPITKKKSSETKVLIISANGGGGHKSTAQALCRELREQGMTKEQVSTVCMQDWLGGVSAFGTKCFDDSIAQGNNVLLNFMTAMQPVFDTLSSESVQKSLTKELNSNPEIKKVFVCEPLGIEAIAKVISEMNANIEDEKDKIELAIYVTDYLCPKNAYMQPLIALMANIEKHNGKITIHYPGMGDEFGMIKNVLTECAAGAFLMPNKTLEAAQAVVNKMPNSASTELVLASSVSSGIKEELNDELVLHELAPKEYLIGKVFKGESGVQESEDKREEENQFARQDNAENIVLTVGSQGNPALIEEYVREALRKEQAQHWIIFAGKTVKETHKTLGKLFNINKKSWFRYRFQTTDNPWWLALIAGAVLACIYMVLLWIRPIWASVVATNLFSTGNFILKLLKLSHVATAISSILPYVIPIVGLFILTAVIASLGQRLVGVMNQDLGQKLSDADVRKKIAGATCYEILLDGKTCDGKTYRVGDQSFTIMPFVPQKYIVQAFNVADTLIVSAGGQSASEAVAYLCCHKKAQHTKKTLLFDDTTHFAWQNPEDGNPARAKTILGQLRGEMMVVETVNPRKFFTAEQEAVHSVPEGGRAAGGKELSQTTKTGGSAEKRQSKKSCREEFGIIVGIGSKGIISGGSSARA